MNLGQIEQAEFAKFTQAFRFGKELKSKTILITGAKGIVGSALIRWVLYENKIYGNNTKIIASTRTPDIIPEYVDRDDLIVFCKYGEEGNISQNLDYIVHAASPTSNKYFTNFPVETLETIIHGTENVLKLAKAQNKCSLIYISSEEVYGTPSLDHLVDELYVGAIDSTKIRNSYPLGKKVAELMCLSYFQEYGINVKIIRPTVIMGLYQDYNSVKVEAEILRCILENKNMVLKSNGLTKKSVIYSLDIVTAILTVLTQGEPGEVYNVTNPSTYCTVLERVQDAFETFNSSLSIEFDFEDKQTDGNGYLPERKLLEDIGKIINLGWKPLYQMSDIYRVDIQRFTASG